MNLTNRLIILLALLGVSSCSTLKKGMVYSALGTGVLSAFAGAALSPNKESRMANALVFGSIGATGGALLGKYFFEEDPENQKMPTMILDETKPQAPSIDLIPPGTTSLASPVTINALPIKKYDLPQAPMPEELKAMARKQYAIEYQVDAKVIQQGNSSFYIKPTTIIEYKVE